MSTRETLGGATGWRARELYASGVVALLWGLSAIGLAAYFVLAVLSAVSPVIRTTLNPQGVAKVALEVRYAAAAEPLAANPSQPRLVGHDNVVLSNRGRTVSDSLLMATAGALALLFLYHLRRLMWTIEQGHPFDIGNASRLRRIAGAMIGIGVLRDIGQFVGLERTLREVGGVVRAALPGAQVGYSAHVSWPWYATAFVAFALAHAFEMGARLQQDHDLTV
jgi:hypothetical protein